MSATEREQVPDQENDHGDSYRPEYCDVAKKMLAAGATISALAETFRVPIATVRRWQSDHEDFLAAFMLGRGRRDRNVERALFKRAVGYGRKVEKTINYKGKLMRELCQEHVPADVGTTIFWLTNRAPADWSNAPQPRAADTGTTVNDILGELHRQIVESHKR